MAEQRRSLSFSRWWLIAGGALAMGMAGTFQFVWSSIRGPLGTQIGTTEATLGTLFTLVIAVQTVVQFPAGWVRDRYGPRIPTLAGALLMTGGYVGLSIASSPVTAGLAVVAGGGGAGAIYTVAVNTPVKWFDEYRGLATGIITMSYAVLSFGLIPLTRGSILGTFQRTLLFFAVLAALTCLLAAIILRDPQIDTTPGGTAEKTDPVTETKEYAWTDVIQTWQFWILYGAFVIVNGVGLMLIGKLIAFSDAMELSAGVATAAASIIAIADGSGVLIVGGLSDRLGSIRTVGSSLLLSAIGIAGAVVSGSSGIAPVFIICVAVAGFFRSPVFAIFPTLIGEYYGRKYSSENYATLYTAKLWGSLFAGSVASILITRVGWSISFLIGAILMGLAGLSVFTIRPVSNLKQS
ncbi:MFS transporter [Haloquadratum walsbyi]|uniref:Major facilitator superfamily transport protein n=1 Tax=Haloquadratum walsbyi (strain DSM 16854 / JCM 12705 / C23) TaxID=768065 RepID=G0LIX6_HALWC|nr:MFS transporter [Haloquadratum walsbyi]CCC40378.1 major facilitator superfamily transport protein [Haloquadratum walsbyi C23]